MKDRITMLRLFRISFSTLFCLSGCFCAGQIVIENMTKGPKYTTFVTLKKSKIKETILKNEYKEWETKLMVDADSMVVHVIEPVLVAWDDDKNTREYDTMNVIDHILYFDSLSTCVKDVKRFIFSKEPDYQAFFATRNLSWKWKKTSAEGLYVSRFKFHLSMQIRRSTESPQLMITHRMHPNWTKEEYEKYFLK
jgi:hypothetical protein